jgi:prepilin-type N-terminal cleavage/methylation domain-containing protein
MSARLERREGFTLLEILMAMTILAIIVLIVSGIFRQSRSAWESGMRRTDLNMEGRSAVTLMSRELSQAVADGARGFYRNNIRTGSAIDFWMLGIATNGERVARHVTYALSGTEVRRKCETVLPNIVPYPMLDASVPEMTLVENVANLTFTTPGGMLYQTNLPAWVDIELLLTKGSKYSVIRVSSDGPPGGPSINSWDPRI